MPRRPSLDSVLGRNKGKQTRNRERRITKRYNETFGSYAPLKKKPRKPGSGGARPGSGPKPKTEEARKARRDALAAAALKQTPLDYMLNVMRDIDAKTDRRDDMAKSSAPYMHHRLNATKVVGGSGDEEALKMEHRVVVKHVRSKEQDQG